MDRKDKVDYFVVDREDKVDYFDVDREEKETTSVLGGRRTLQCQSRGRRGTCRPMLTYAIDGRSSSQYKLQLGRVDYTSLMDSMMILKMLR